MSHPYGIDMKALGERARAARKAVSATQDEVAAVIGVRRQAVAAIERAVVVDPGIQTLAGIAHATGLSLAELVDPAHAAVRQEAAE